MATRMPRSCAFRIEDACSLSFPSFLRDSLLEVSKRLNRLFCSSAASPAHHRRRNGVAAVSLASHGGQGISAAVNVPIEWNATSHIAWKAETPGRGWSSPVLSHGKLYLTAAVPDAGSTDLTLHAFCMDAKDGRILWDTEVFRPEPSVTAKMHPKNSPASGTPIVTEDRLYVHFGHMGTAALDLSGKIVWQQTELKYSPVHGNGGSPILLGDELIFSCDGETDPFVAALDAKTGAVRWKTPRNSTARKKFSFCTPLAIKVGAATEVISPGSGFVGAYDPKDGRELWRVRYGEGYSVVPRPVFAQGLLFLSSGFDAPCFTRSALRAHPAMPRHRTSHGPSARARP